MGCYGHLYGLPWTPLVCVCCLERCEQFRYRMCLESNRVLLNHYYSSYLFLTIRKHIDLITLRHKLDILNAVCIWLEGCMQS
jgi:hypothetical protein